MWPDGFEIEWVYKGSFRKSDNVVRDGVLKGVLCWVSTRLTLLVFLTDFLIFGVLIEIAETILICVFWGSRFRKDDRYRSNSEPRPVLL